MTIRCLLARSTSVADRCLRHAPISSGQVRAAKRIEADLELVLESVHEGYLLHHGTPRVIRSDDPDLALLAGDRLYALGLELLAQAEDIASVRSLSEAIALCAHAHAADSPSLADAVWEATTSELGWGATPELSRAKAAARAGAPEAEAQLRAAAAAARSVAAR